MLKLFGKKNRSPDERLQEIVGEYELPSFPQVVMKVLQVIRDPESTMDDVAQALQADPGLVSKLLMTVNSAAFGLQRGVDNVYHAAAMMGRARVESLVLALATRDTLPSIPSQGFEAQRFWRAAARRATLARSLAQKLHPATQTECFTAALLEDMAVPVLATARGDEYGPVLDEWHRTPGSDLETLEIERLGFTHTEVGRIVAEKWELPTELRASIAGHHGADDDHPPEPAILLASQIRESDMDPGVEKIVEIARANYGLAPDEVVATVDESFDKAAELARLLR